jgi:hypothetical protein
MNPLKFLNSFQDEESRIAADKERIAAEERELEHLKNVAARRNSLRDRLDADTSRFDALCGQLDAESSFKPEEFVDNLLLGFKIGDLATRLNAVESLKANLKEIKADLQKKIIGPAKQNLDAFEREHKSILSKLPPPVKMAEKPFVASNLDHLHFANGNSSELVKRAAGII